MLFSVRQSKQFMAGCCSVKHITKQH